MWRGFIFRCAYGNRQLGRQLNDPLFVKQSALLFNQVKLIVIFSFIGIVALISFGLVNLSLQNNIAGIFEIVLGIVCVGNLFLLRFTHRMAVVARIMLLALGSMLVFLLYNGGIQATGIYWFYTFPGAAFFLTGKREGALWITLLFVLIIAGVALQTSGFIFLVYSFIAIRQLLISLLVTTLLIYFYQSLNEHDQVVIKEHNKELQDTTKMLQDQIKKLQAVSDLTAHLHINDDAITIMEKLVATLQQLYPTLTVSYVILNTNDAKPLPVYIYAAHTIGDVYLKVIREDLILGLSNDIKSQTKNYALDMRLVKGSNDAALAAFPASHMTLPLMVEAGQPRLIHLCSVEEGLFSQENLDIIQALIATVAHRLSMVALQVNV